MKLRTAFLTLALLLLPLSFAFAEALNVEQVEQYLYPELDEVYAIDISGSNAFVVDETGLKIFDITTYPRALGFLDIPGESSGTGGIKVHGDYAYVGAGDKGFVIIDISDPATPQIVSNTDLGSPVSGIDYEFGVAFIASGSSVFYTYDVSDPIQPELLDSFDNQVGSAMNVTVRNEVAFVSYEEDGLVLIDISDPADLNYFGTIEGTAYDVDLRGDVGFIASGEAGLRVYDVSDPGEPSLFGTFDTDASAFAVTIDGNSAYVGEMMVDQTPGGLRTIDVSDPRDMSQISYYQNDLQGSYLDIELLEDFAYVIDYYEGNYSGLRVINISDNEEPYEAAFYSAGGLDRVIIDNNRAFVSGTHFNRISVADITKPTIDSWLVNGDFEDMDWAGTYVYAVDTEGEVGVKTYNLADPDMPVFLGSYESGVGVNSFTLFGNYLFFTQGEDGFTIITAGNPANLQFRSTFDTDGHANDIEVRDYIAYVADGDNGLVIVNCVDENEPILVGQIETNGYATEIKIDGNYAYIADGDGGFTVVNIEDPANPTIAANLPTDENTTDIHIDDTNAYLLDSMNGIRVVNIEHPDDPEEDGYYTAENPFTDIFVDNVNIYATDINGLGIYHFTPPVEFPQIIFEPELVDFGEIWVSQVGEEAITITNEGRADLVVTSVTIEGDEVFATDFVDPVTLARNESFHINVTFTPEAAIAYDATVIIESNDENNNMVTVDLVGTGYTLPFIEVAPMQVEHLDVEHGSQDFIIDITNNGNGVLIWDTEIEIVEEAGEGFDWIMIDEVDGATAPEATDQVTLTLNSDMVTRGAYEANLHILSNDDTDPDVVVNVLMTVDGIGLIETDMGNLDFGEIMTGHTMDLPIEVMNSGNGTLAISDVMANADYMTVDFEAAFTLEPDESTIFTVTFAPEMRGLYEGDLTFTSDDPFNPEFTVGLSGTGLSWPAITIDPMTVINNGGGEEMFTISNGGDVELEWESRIAIVPDPTRDANQRQARGLAPLREMQRDLRVDPDEMGYEFRDNEEDDGPVFNWYSMDDFDNINHMDLGDNENSGALALGFEFPFWDRMFEEVYVHSDGWLSFTDNGDHSEADAWGDFPHAGDTENCIMFLNADHINHAGSGLDFWTNNEDMAIVWLHADYELMAQVVLYKSGLVLMQYGEGVGGQFPWYRVGVNLGDGEHGWSISLNERWFLRNGLAITFGPSYVWNDWVMVEPAEGIIPGHNSQDVNVTFDIEDVWAGVYDAELHVMHNDPEMEEMVVDIQLVFDPFTIDQTELESENGGRYSFQLANNLENPLNFTTEIEVLEGHDIDWDEWIEWSPMEGVIDPKGTFDIDIEMQSDGIPRGDYSAIIHVISEDENVIDHEFEILMHAYESQLEVVGMLDTPGDAWDVEVLWDYAFVGDEHTGVRVLNVDDVTNPQEVSVLDTPGWAIRLEVHGDYVYVADRTEGLRIIDVTDPENPVDAGFFETPNIAYDVVYEDGIAYVTDREGGLIAVDVTDPENPVELGSITNGISRAYGLEIGEDYAYVGDLDGAMHIIDITDPTNMVEVSHFNTDGATYDIDLNGHWAYLADGFNGLTIVDVSDPENPVFASSFDTPGTAFSLDFYNDYIYVADQQGGLRIFDVSDPMNPVWADAYLELDNIYGITVYHGWGYVAAMAEGVYILDLGAYTDGHEAPPLIGLDVEMIESMNGGDYDVTVSNSGELDLEWSATYEITAEPNMDQINREARAINQNDIQRDGMMAPDPFGYFWVDGMEDGGPEYDWYDIAMDDYMLNAEDDWTGTVDLGWTFNWYGMDYDAISISANGFIMLGEDDSRHIELPRAPNAGAPNSILMPNNMDLNPRLHGDLYFWTNGEDMAVVTWQEVSQFRFQDNHLTFQAILNADGSVKYQYQTVGIHGGGYSNIGWEDPTGEYGTSIVYHEQDAIADGHVICIDNRFGDWLSVDPMGGTIAPEDNQVFTVSLDANHLVYGDYHADLTVWSNDPMNDEIIIPVDMTVEEIFDSNQITYYLFFGTYIPGQGPGPVMQISFQGETVEEGETFVIPDYDLDDYNLGESFDAYMAGLSGTEIQIEPEGLEEDIEVHMILNNLVVTGDGENEPMELVGIYSPDPDLEDQLWLLADLQVWSTDPDSVQLNESEHFDFANDMNMIVDFTVDNEFMMMMGVLNLHYQELGGAMWNPIAMLWDYQGAIARMFVEDNLPHLEMTVGHLSIIAGGPEGGFDNTTEYTISLEENWNLFSSPVMPTDDDIPTLWADVVNEGNLSILKDHWGRFYAPEFGFNNLPVYNPSFGYQAKMTAADELVFMGEPIPFYTPIMLDAGWSIVAYYPEDDLDVMDAFANLGDELELVKDGHGHFWAPEFGFSNMNMLTQGEGYKVKVTAETELVWNTEMQEEVAADFTANESQRYGIVDPGGYNMSVLVAGGESFAGMEVSAWSTSGKLCGSGVFNANGTAGLAVWGDDPATEAVEGLLEGEAIELRIWDTSNQVELQVNASEILAGKGLVYGTDEFTALGSVQAEVAVPENYYLSQNYPNPFNNVTRLTFGMPEAGNVSVKVFDLTGRMVAELVGGSLEAGHHTITWNAQSAPAGLYMIQMQADGFDYVRKVMLLK